MKTRFKFFVVAALIATLTFAVASCFAQLNGNFNRVRLVPSTTETGTTARNGTMIYNSTANKFRFYENGGWTNLIPPYTNAVLSYRYLGSTIKAETIPVQVVANSGVVTIGRIEFASIWLQANTVCNGVSLYINTGGTYPVVTDSTQVALFSYSTGTLTRVAISLSGQYWTVTGQQNVAFITPYTIPTDGLYYIAFLYNEGGAGTRPIIARGPTLTAAGITLTNSAKIAGYYGFGSVSIPSSFLMSDMTIGQNFFWGAIY